MLAIACSAASARAQQSIPSSVLYGRGVDAYYSGNTGEAEKYLSQAIVELPDDPRPYYFRALTFLRSGRQDEARTDMAAGATLEARRPRQFAVGTALERVQGSDRLLLEQFRRKGQATAALDRDQQNHGRYEQHVDSDGRLLRETTAPNPSSPPSFAPAMTPIDANPFADENSQPASQPKSAEAVGSPFSSGTAAGLKPEQSNSAAKKPPGKLLGVLGRVLEKTVPLPSVEGLRNELPTSSLGATSGQPTLQPPKTKNDAKSAPPNTNEDPFGG